MVACFCRVSMKCASSASAYAAHNNPSTNTNMKQPSLHNACFCDPYIKVRTWLWEFNTACKRGVRVVFRRGACTSTLSTGPEGTAA